MYYKLDFSSKLIDTVLDVTRGPDVDTDKQQVVNSFAILCKTSKNNARFGLSMKVPEKVYLKKKR